MLAFGISIGVLQNETEYSSVTNPILPCKSPSSFTNMLLTKDTTSNVHNRYISTPFDGKINQYCPTSDVTAYYNNDYIGKTSGDISKTTVNTMKIIDCHGNTLYIVRTADSFRSVINNNIMQVSFEMRDSTNNNVLVYADEHNFFSPNITFKNTNGKLISNMYQDLDDAHIWNIYSNDTTVAGGDFLTLILIAGKQSVYSDGTDFCTSYYWGVIWFIVALSCYVGLVGILWLLCHMKCYKRNDDY
jgi:hypothetical protein